MTANVVGNKRVTDIRANWLFKLAIAWLRSQIIVLMQLPRQDFSALWIQVDGIGEERRILPAGSVVCQAASSIRGIAAQASLVWETMNWSIERGFQTYDFAGAG